MIASTARDCPVVPAVPPLPTAACQPTPETWALRLSEGTESSAGAPDEGASPPFSTRTAWSASACVFRQEDLSKKSIGN